MDPGKVQIEAGSCGFDWEGSQQGGANDVELLAGFNDFRPTAEEGRPEGTVRLGSTLPLRRQSSYKGGGVKAPVFTQGFATTKRDDVFSLTPSHIVVCTVKMMVTKYSLPSTSGDYSAALRHEGIDKAMAMEPP